MRICFLNHDLSNKTGAGRFCLALLSALKKLIPNLEYRVLTHDNFLPCRFWQWPAIFPKIRKIFKNYDIIHALDGWPYGVIAAIASLGLKKKKLIITAIGTGAVQPLYSFWKRSLLKWAYRKADVVTAVSNNTKKEILKFLPNLKIEVINHGVDFTKFKSILETADIPELKPYILSVGALKKRKGYEYSIKAFAEASKRFPDLKYVIVGEGSEREALRRQVSSTKSQDKIIFLKNLPEEELITLYKNAELFILLPQDVDKDIEGFGLVFLEAAAAGLPVIATKGTSAEDAVLDGKNGILVPPNDYLTAAEAITKILSDKNLKEMFFQKSINFAKLMDWEEAAKKYMRIYSVHE